MIEPEVIHRTNGQLAFMNNPKSHWFGWIFYKHPDGQWVSLQNMRLDELLKKEQEAKAALEVKRE